MKTVANLSVLVIGDNPWQKKFVAEQLSMLGCPHLLIATNPEEAMSILATCSIDLIFADIDMPDKRDSRFAAAQEKSFSGNREKSPVLVWLSSHGENVPEPHLQAARSAGFRFVEATCMPLTPALLNSAVIKALNLMSPGRPDCETNGMPSRKLMDAIVNDDDIVRAICDNNELEVWYQPHISLETKAIIGADATVRWSHHKFSYLSPGQFAGLIEKQGLGLMLFYRTFNHALKTQQKLQKSGHHIPICVKASAATLETQEVADYLFDCTRRYAIEPSLITVGISSQNTQRHASNLAASLNRVRLRGFGLSVDDLSSGISAMKMLSHMPFTEIRIDRYFVRQFLRQTQCRVIVESIINIARRLKLKVIAEGIENVRQMEVLAAMGCVRGQGDVAEAMGMEEFLNNIGAGRLL